MNFDLLRGLRVVESSAFIAAPLAGMTLAQFGADVIRIDMLGGGIDYARLPVMPQGRSLYWTGLNKAKRSIAVDIRKPEGRELVRALVTAPGDNGGVLLTNMGAPWLSHASLAEQRTDLISCTIEGNSDGSTAVDYTINCAAGFPAITGGGSPAAPVNHVLPAWDIACAFQAAFAISAAAANRQATGRGAELRIALSDVAFSMLSHLGMLGEAELLGQERPSIGNYLFGAFGRDFATLDGSRVFLAAISLSQWKNLVKACALAEPIQLLESQLGLDFANERERYDAREQIAQLVADWCCKRSLAEVSEIFGKFGVCWGPYQTVRQALSEDPRVSDTNPIFERVETAGIGRHLIAGTPIRIAGAQRGATPAAPLLGQNTDEILMEVLRLDAAVVGRMHDAGIVAGPESDPLAAARRVGAT
jgi:2-methylfumaryl-CoA isomerase